MVLTALRGRTNELDALVQAAENARAGSGTTVLLEGEAGIGKTRLIDEIAARADDLGMQVRRGTAEELEQGRPFGSLVDALGSSDTAPRLGDDAAAEATRVLIQDAFVDHLERLAASPLLLALDDLQWADRATMATLWALARRSSDMGLLLVLAFRPTPTPPGLERLLEGSDRIGALRIRLGPVADAALDDLALDVLGAPPTPALREQLQGAGGNPFVALELLAARSADARDVRPGEDEDDLAGSQLPPALRGALLARFTGLSATARRVLPVAAVLGGSARVDDLAALLGITSDEAGEVVTEAVDAGLLQPTGDSLSFRHDLIREALYESLPNAVRIGWHREAARILEGGAEPTVVAQHLMLGATRGDPDTLAALRRAAAQLGDAPDVAAALLERASALSVDPATRAETEVARARALLRAGHAEEAERQANTVLAVAAATPAIRAQALLTRARSLLLQARYGEANAVYGDALATGELEPRTVAVTRGMQALTSAFSLGLDRALEQSGEAEAEGTGLNETEAVVHALMARCMVYLQRSEFELAVAAGREAMVLSDREGATDNGHVLGFALVAADRAEEARATTERGRQRALSSGDIPAVGAHQLTLAFIAWSSGRWDDAVVEVGGLGALAEDFGLPVGDPMAHAVIGNIAFHRGDRAGAQSELEGGRSAPPAGAVPQNLLARLSALMLELDGDIDGAFTLLFEAMQFQSALGIDAGRNMLGVECARLAVAAGRIGEAEELVSDLAAFGERAVSPAARGTANFARGIVEGDGPVLRKAATEFEAASRPLQRMRSLEAAGHAFARAGAQDDAVSSLRDALTVTDELGAVHDSRRITAILRDLGVRIGAKDQSARPPQGWESLTKAERDVAQLLAEGLRNREIADRLVVSRRTVETHVSRLYTKLGAENRVALAQAIRENLEHEMSR